MRLLIEFQSEAWRDYGADLAENPEAWSKNNPAVVQLGPFDAVEVARDSVIGHHSGKTHVLARPSKEGTWLLTGAERFYDRFRITASAACFALAWLLGS